MEVKERSEQGQGWSRTFVWIFEDNEKSKGLCHSMSTGIDPLIQRTSLYNGRFLH